VNGGGGGHQTVDFGRFQSQSLLLELINIIVVHLVDTVVKINISDSPVSVKWYFLTRKLQIKLNIELLAF